MFINLHQTASMTMHEDATRELQVYEQQHGPEEGLLKCLNNFRFHLPGGWYRDLASLCLDVPYSQLERAHTLSPKKSQQTPEEFYKAIDRALAAEGIVIPQRLRPFVGEKNPFFKGIRAQMIEIHTLVLPGYAHLRDDGYTHSDLTA